MIKNVTKRMYRNVINEKAIKQQTSYDLYIFQYVRHPVTKTFTMPHPTTLHFTAPVDTSLPLI
jgi:hypothetical protein